MRDEKEGSKQGQKNNKAKQHSTPNMYVYMYVSCYLRLSAGDLELKVNSDGVEGMERTDGSGLGGSCTIGQKNAHTFKYYNKHVYIHVHVQYMHIA